MRLRRPYAGPFGGCFSGAGLPVGVVVACIVATLACILGGVYLYGGHLTNISMHDRGLSDSIASRWGSFSNRSILFRPSASSRCADTLENTCPPPIECPPPLFLKTSEDAKAAAEVPIPVLESLPLLNIDVWGEQFARWGSWTMKRYWDENTLKNAIRASDPVQLYPLIQKLQAGQPIVVVALGSSIVENYGGVFHRRLETIYKLVPHPLHRFYEWGDAPEEEALSFSAPDAPWQKGWLELFMQYVNHTWPHPDHVLINSGKAGAVPNYFAEGSCLEYMLPTQADLVVIETMGVPDAAGIERLSWRVLRHFQQQQQQRPPAILYFNTIDVAPWPVQDKPGWGLNCGGPPEGAPPGSNLTDCCSLFTPGGVGASFTPAGNRHQSDTEHHELARYYGFGSISHRDFLWPYIKAKAWEWLAPEYGECGYLSLTNSDSIHPSHLGKVLFADYLWTYLSIGKVAYARRHVINYLTTTYENQNNVTATSAAEEKTVDENNENTSTSSEESLISSEEMVDIRWKNAKLPLIDGLSGAAKAFPVPSKAFVPSGRSIYETRCYGLAVTGTKSLLHKSADSGKKRGNSNSPPLGLPIIKSEGFEFHENTTHGPTPKRKPGWVAMEVGAYMELELDTFFEENNNNSTNKEGGAQTTALDSPDVVITYLKSYEHMGRAYASCEGGCECTGTEIEAHHGDKYSISWLHVVPVTQSKKCRFKIEVLEGTSSGEHKFKVTQVTTRMRISPTAKLT